MTDDDAAVANLISMYLSWDHASCRIFDENYFIEHLLSGEEGYCSALLVNAILAVATVREDFHSGEVLCGFNLGVRKRRLWTDNVCS